MLPPSGRCPACGDRIGPYPFAVELAAAAAIAAVTTRVPQPWEAAALAWLVLIGVPLAFIDLAVRRLPDPLTAAAFVGTAGLLAAAALAGHDVGALGRACAGAAVLTGAYLVVVLAWPGGMGLGDAKLAASIGLVLGWTSWQSLLTGTFAGFALAAVYGGARLATRQATQTSQLPLGPFMLAGALATLAFLHL
jgi:leader peptidase (prepilin peptidase)/N-methyltransferase